MWLHYCVHILYDCTTVYISCLTALLSTYMHIVCRHYCVHSLRDCTSVFTFCVYISCVTALRCKYPAHPTRQWEPCFTLYWAFSSVYRSQDFSPSLSPSLFSGISLLYSLPPASPLVYGGELLEAIGRQPAFTSCHLPLCSAFSLVCFAMHIAYY